MSSFAGPLPPTLTGAPPSSGPGVAPHGLPGQAAGSMGDLKMALEMLQKALPGVPMGTELHEAVLKAVTNIGKHMGEMAQSQQEKGKALLEMLMKLKQQGPNQALAGMAAPLRALLRLAARPLEWLPLPRRPAWPRQHKGLTPWRNFLVPM